MGRTALHEAYARLVERAAAAGLLPATGLTPREQAASLLTADRFTVSEVERLRDVYEQCTFSGTASAAQIAEGVEISDRLAAALPVPLIERTKRRRGVLGLRAVLRFLAAAIPYVFIATIATIVIFLLARAPWGSMLPTDGISMPTGGPSMSAEQGLSADLLVEFSNASVAASDASWISSPANPSWAAHAVPKTLAANDTVHSDWQPFDYDTGTDGYFPGAIDPFRPRLAWTHRRLVYNAVDSGFQPIDLPGTFRSASGVPATDAITHEVEVDVRFAANRPVPIPSATPGSVVVDYSPPEHMAIRFRKDDADVLYAISDSDGRVRLHYRLASAAAYRSGGLPDVPFEPRARPLPDNVRAEANVVLEAIGGLPRPSFRETVQRLHAYFAGFTVSPLTSDEMRDSDFLTIALARKGVCRHRARTFFITANAAGVETRLVENRTHSFCEIRLPDGTWRRMEFRRPDEEGPPGLEQPAAQGGSAALVAGRARPDPSLTVDTAAMLLLPLALLLLAGHLWLGSRIDRTGHLVRIGPRPSRFMRRGHRDENGDVSRLRVATMAELTLSRLAQHLAVEPGQLWETMSQEPAGWESPLARARVHRLLIQVQRRDHERIDAPALQRLYWDCFNILDRIHRVERP